MQYPAWACSPSTTVWHSPVTLQNPLGSGTLNWIMHNESKSVFAVLLPGVAVVYTGSFAMPCRNESQAAESSQPPISQAFPR